MKEFKCKDFIVKNFDVNSDSTYGTVEFTGRNYEGQRVYQFWPDERPEHLIQVIPFFFKPVKRVCIIDTGLLEDGTPVVFVSLTIGSKYQSVGGAHKIE